jgi:hypothetical protein
MSFTDFLKLNKNEAPTITNEALEYERKIRETVGLFPLHVFHDRIKPYIDILATDYDLPRSYIGTMFLTGYSSAIGTAAVACEGQDNMSFFPIWSCLVGISSAGKSLVNNKVLGPLYEMQAEYDKQWAEDVQDLEASARVKMQMKQLIIRDVHVPTIMRYVMPDNPKGIMKDADEILEWINGMNATSKNGKEGTDEQFYLSSWNCRKYSAIRTMKDKYVIGRPFINVTGGVQPSVAPKLFANNRDTTGFIFRVLFAPPERHRIARPNFRKELPKELTDLHRIVMRMLVEKLQVESDEQVPWKFMITEKASAMKRKWEDELVGKINQMADLYDVEVHSGIYGKIQEYINRFAGILAVTDVAYNNYSRGQYFFFTEKPGVIDEDIMARALELSMYYYKSAAETHRIVSVDLTVPTKVVVLANLFRQGQSLSKMAESYFGDKDLKVKMSRELNKLVKKYPRIFGSRI